MRIFLILFFVVSLIVGMLYYDESQLTHEINIYQLADKWHETDCVPLFDGNGNYMGESCSDDWTLVVLSNNTRKEIYVSGDVFKNFLTGDTIKREYDKGRLGFSHNEYWSKLA